MPVMPTTETSIIRPTWAGLFSLVVFAALVIAAAATGATYKPGAWYAELNKPWWTPDDWVFPVVWTILYFMIGIAGWLAWRDGGWSGAIVAWGLGLAFNAAWSCIFFEMQDIRLALADIGALWLATAAFIVLAWKHNRSASLLFVPYLAWVTLAAALNYEIWRLN